MKETSYNKKEHSILGCWMRPNMLTHLNHCWWVKWFFIKVINNNDNWKKI